MLFHGAAAVQIERDVRGKGNSIMDYYGELCTKMYESDKSLANESELAFYLSFVRDRRAKVLEPMCGNGRMLVPFMQKGIDMEGFDMSEEMLKACRKKAKKYGLDPNVYQKKIEDFKSDKTYDLILVPFGSFSLLPDHLVPVSLQNLKSVLNPDGKMILTIVEKSGDVAEIPEWTETNRKHFENEIIVEYKMVHFDAERNRLDTRLKYQSIRDNRVMKTEIMDFPLRLYGLEEFTGLLVANGFSSITVHEVRNGYGEGRSFHAFECAR
jgi:SAM-dependent methyltransferase